MFWFKQEKIIFFKQTLQISNVIIQIALYMLSEVLILAYKFTATYTISFLDLSELRSLTGFMYNISFVVKQVSFSLESVAFFNLFYGQMILTRCFTIRNRTTSDNYIEYIVIHTFIFLLYICYNEHSVNFSPPPSSH